MFTLSKQKKDILILVVGKVLQVIISLVSIKILTEILSTDEVGQYYLLLSILTLLNFTFLNPLGQYYSRHVIAWELSKNLRNATFLLVIIRSIAIFIALFCAYWVFNYFEYDKYYSVHEFILFIFIALLAGTQLVFIGTINTLGDRVRFIKILIFTLLLGLLVSLLMMFYIEKAAMNWLYGVAIAQLLCIIPTYKYLVKQNNFSILKIKQTISKRYISKVAYFIIPITMTLFLQWGQNVSYRFIIEAKYSIEILAFIAVGLSVSVAIFSAAEGLAMQYFNPLYLRKISNSSKDIRTKAWNDLANYMIPIYIMLTIFVISLSPYLIKILVAEKFHEAYIFTMLGALIGFFRVITSLVYMVSQSEVKTKTTILPYAIGTAISIGVLYLADFSSQLWAIPVVLSVVNGLIFIMLFLNMRKLLPISIGFKPIIKALLLSLPFVSIYFLSANDSLGAAFAIVAVAGLYLLFGLYICKPKEALGE